MGFQFDGDLQKDYIKVMLAHCVKKNEMPNYFARYALVRDLGKYPLSLPRGDLSDNEIQNAISTITSFWNKNKNNPKYNRILQQLLNENAKVKEYLLDPTERSRYMKAVETDIARLQDQIWEEVDAIIDVLVEEARITTDDFQYICKASKAFSEDQIEARLKTKKIIIIPPGEEPEEEDFLKVYPMLEPSVIKNIRGDLNVFKVASLYEFLGLKMDAPADRIEANFKTRHDEWKKKPVSVEKTAAQVILGNIDTHLIKGDRTRYDNSMQFEQMAKNDPVINASLKDGILEEDKFSDLVSKARHQGIDEQFASLYILDKAKKQKVPVRRPKDKDENTFRCSFCSRTNPITNEFCNNCGKPLYITCPQCGTRERSSNKACSKCGFVFGEIAKLKALLGEADLLQRKGFLQDALDTLLDARKLAANNPEIQKKIATLEEEVGRVKALFREYESARFEKKLYLARDKLHSLRQKNPNYEVPGTTLDALLAQLNAGITQAEKELQAAKQLEQQGKNDDAILAYERVLHSCADCTPAQTGMARIPPDPPANCTVAYQPGGAVVRWTKCPSIGEITYHIVRKERSVPTSAQDGTTVAQTKYLAAEDADGKIGHNYFYSVFSERGGAFSPRGAGSDSVLFFGDVKNLTLMPGDGFVEASWDLPGDVKGVRAVRREGSAPSGVDDGTEIALLGTTKFLDRNVVNGHRYYYLIACEFMDGSANSVFSRGVRRDAIPNSPPPAILDFFVSKEKSSALISWEPPARGSVAFYKSQSLPGLREGSVCSRNDLGALGTPLRSGGAMSAVDEAPGNGVCYYTPVTVEGDVAVIGRLQKLTFLDDVSNLNVQNHGTYLKLKWRWPPDCSQALVCWRSDLYPNGTEDQKAHCEVYSKGQYELKGSYQLDNPGSHPYFFKVFAGYRSDTETLYSSGIDPACRVQVTNQSGTIRYSVKKKLFKKYSVVFESDATIEALPTIVLVARNGAMQPLNIGEGMEIMRISGTQIGPNKSHVADLPGSTLPKPCYIKAFFADKESYGLFRIEHPGPDEATLS